MASYKDLYFIKRKVWDWQSQSESTPAPRLQAEHFIEKLQPQTCHPFFLFRLEMFPWCLMTSDSMYFHFLWAQSPYFHSGVHWRERLPLLPRPLQYILGTFWSSCTIQKIWLPTTPMRHFSSISKIGLSKGRGRKGRVVWKCKGFTFQESRAWVCKNRWTFPTERHFLTIFFWLKLSKCDVDCVCVKINCQLL